MIWDGCLFTSPRHWVSYIVLCMQNNKGKGGLKYLLQQTELFAHFAKSDSSASQKKGKGRCGECSLSRNILWLIIWSFMKYYKHTVSCGFHFIFRGRHASKLTEKEEDEEYLKEEDGAIPGSGGTRLLTQPACKYLTVASFFILKRYAHLWPLTRRYIYIGFDISRFVSRITSVVASQFLRMLCKFCSVLEIWFIY